MRVLICTGIAIMRNLYVKTNRNGVNLKIETNDLRNNYKNVPHQTKHEHNFTDKSNIRISNPNNFPPIPETANLNTFQTSVPKSTPNSSGIIAITHNPKIAISFQIVIKSNSDQLSN